MIWRAIVLVSLVTVAAVAGSQEKTLRPPTEEGQRASFSLRYGTNLTSYRIGSAFLLPDETLSLEAVFSDSEGSKTGFHLTVPAGVATVTAERRWEWKAPRQAGLYRLRVSRKDSDDAITLNVFVLVSIQTIRNGYLGGYRIGSYPPPGKRGMRPPRGFIEVTPENEGVELTPHFRLKQFLCKQPGSYPKYLVLNERLPLKLEAILERLNEKGYAVATFHVMSGYRTPAYNKGLGNVAYSRHLWGEAADIYVDESPRDGVMDDLNKDGKTNARDSAIIYDVIEEMHLAGEKGGLAKYKSNGAHGPFVHVDVRDYLAKW